MSWKNFSLKRGNEKVAISNINTIISNDIQKVWNIVLGQFTRNYTQTTKRGLLTTNKG